MKNLCKKLTDRWWKKILFAIALIIFVVVLCKAWGALYDNVINVKPHEQQVVLITGTASGIGEATAKLLIEEGHIVYGGDIQFEKNKWLDEAGGHSLDMDVTSSTMVAAGVDRVIAEQGRIDVLFNNAGFGMYAPIEEASIEDAKWQFEVNVFGYANLVKEVLPHMRAQGDGLIINNTSMGGKIWLGGLGGWYHASKHALEGWSDVLRFEVREFGVDVVIIEPGAIDTNFGAVAQVYADRYREDTVYEHLYAPMDAMREQMESEDGGGFQAADPIVIAEVVSQAMNAKKPDIRYARGPLANELIIFRDIFGDRVFDFLMHRMFGG